MLQYGSKFLRICAVALSVAIVAPLAPAAAEVAKSNGEEISADAQKAAAEFRAYLDGLVRSGARPDLTAPPAADMLRRATDAKRLDALPPARGEDLPWMMEWLLAANQMNKAIMFFGVSPPEPQTNPDAFQRNVREFEDQEAAIAAFLLRLTALQIPAAAAFMEALPAEQRTKIRQEGFRKMRVGNAEMILSDLGWIAAGMKPANARILSAAMRDTGAAWAAAILSTDRPTVLRGLENVRAAIKDEETRDNLAAFAAVLEQAK